MPGPLKTFVLWFILVGMFFGSYFVFSEPGSEASPVASVLDFLPVLFGGAIVVFIAFAYARGTRANKLNMEGINLLNQGRYSEALQRFEEYARRQKDAPAASFNVGATRLALWQPVQAMDHFEKVITGKTGFVIGAAGYLAALRGHARANIGLALALVGRSDDAGSRLNALEGGKEPVAATAFLARAVLACRAGDWAAARQHLLRHEVQQLGGHQRALSDTLLSWTSERTGGLPVPLNKVALYGETGPEHVRSVWPELVDFVDRAPSV